MRSLKAALALAALTAVGGCSVIQKIPAFQQAPELSYQAPGSLRLPLNGGEGSIAVADALKGKDFVIPPPTPITAWQLPGGTPEQSIEHVTAAADFRVAWKRNIGRGSSKTEFITAPPIAVGGRIFVMDAAARVSALNAANGAFLWTIDMTPQGGGGRFESYIPDIKFPFMKGGNYKDYHTYGGGLAYDQGKVFVTSGFRFVAALDANTGTQVWRTPVNIPIHAAPNASGGRLYAVNINNELVSFNQTTGTSGWQYNALQEPARLLQASSPAVSGDAVIASFSSGEVSAVQAANGAELWTGNLIHSSRTTALSEIRDISARPIVFKGDVLVGGHSGSFGAIDLRTGALRWQLPITTTESAWAAGDVVYVVTKDGKVVCIQRATGQIYWIHQLNNDGGPNTERSGFLGLGNNVNSRVYWSGVILASNRLITVSTSGFAKALDPKTGADIGTLKLGGTALLTPIAVGDYVYVLLDNGKLVAIR